MEKCIFESANAATSLGRLVGPKALFNFTRGYILSRNSSLLPPLQCHTRADVPYPLAKVRASSMVPASKQDSF